MNVLYQNILYVHINIHIMTYIAHNLNNNSSQKVPFHTYICSRFPNCI